MIKRYAFGHLGILISLIVLLAILGSIQYIDAEVAVRVMRFLSSFKTLHQATENIPDILPYLVGTGTLLMWVIYFYRLYKKKVGVKTQFLRLAATALPASYLLKAFFQFAFGRTSVRLWLTAGKPLTFDWFNGFESGSFPSGHMTVYAAFGTAVWIYFPQHRKLVFVLLTLLGVTLIATDYHFLSDVIAGACLGVITTYFLRYLFEKRKVRQIEL